jgi:precorrin-2 dehydrogenase/sirohydrochlorin ferrochelatase
MANESNETRPAQGETHARPHPYLACLDLTERLCVVVGGGGLAVRHVTALLESGARVRVVAPTAVEHLTMLAKVGRIELIERAYAASDLVGAALTFAALDDPEANAQVTQDAQAAGSFCHVEGAAPAGDFMVPALLRRGDITVAVAAESGLAGYVRRVRDLIAVALGPEYGQAANLYGSVRANILAAEEARHPALWDSLFALDLPRVIHDRGYEAARTVLAGWVRRQRLT